MNFKTKSLTTNETSNVQKDLQFIDQVTSAAKSLGYRVIIHGGYAVDGALGIITRPHNDLDIQLYGNDTASKAIRQLLQTLDPALLINLEDKGRKDFYHYFHLKRPNTLVEFYYLQITTDPFAQEKIILRENGTLSELQPYDTIHVTLEGTSYETQNPATELADKIYKREFRGDPKKEKHEQDISNLRLLVSKDAEEKELEKMKTR